MKKKKHRFSRMIGHPVPMSGPVVLLRDEVDANWIVGDRICQHGGEFRFFAESGERVTLNPDDACWLIDKFRMGASKSDLFRRSIIWSQEQTT